MAEVENGIGEAVLAGAERDAAVAAVKARLNVGIADDDALIAAFAESALGLAEQFTGRALIVREMTAQVTAGAGWCVLPAVPVRAITGVTRGDGGALAGDAYAVDIDAGGRGWVRVAGAGEVVAVRFSAGAHAGWAVLPPALREGVAMLAAHLYRDREERMPPPAAVSALWRPFREVRLAQAVPA